MSEGEETTRTENNGEEDSNEPVPEPVSKPVIEQNIKKSNKTSKQMVKESKQRAIDNYNKGIIDPEWRVVKMSNGKYRTYKRKEPLPPDPINVNQVMPNKPAPTVAEENTIVHTNDKTKTKQDDPLANVIYYNLNNQINDQLNKRIDMINEELQRLRNKNSKLKNKVKNLKQAIFISDDEENNNEPEPMQQDNRNNDEPQPQQLTTTTLPTHVRRNTGINFNQFFN